MELLRTIHTPVLKDEVIKYLVSDLKGIYVDCTLGTGGHLSAISNVLKPEAVLIGIDLDPVAVEFCKLNLKLPQKSHFINSNFSSLYDILSKLGILGVDGILIDLGMSSYALSDPARGFSYELDGLLDMRFSPDIQETAEDFINSAPVELIEKVIREYGEERGSARIASAIKREREVNRIRTTTQLKNIVTNSIESRYPIKTLSRVFQAIRIYINRELESLKTALPQTLDGLNNGGRLVVVSYHSLEDRIVKEFMKTESRNCICPPEFPECKCNHRSKLEIITKRAVKPGEQEIRMNPKSRSARLRAARRVKSQYEEKKE